MTISLFYVKFICHVKYFYIPKKFVYSITDVFSISFSEIKCTKRLLRKSRFYIYRDRKRSGSFRRDDRHCCQRVVLVFWRFGRIPRTKSFARLSLYRRLRGLFEGLGQWKLYRISLQKNSCSIGYLCWCVQPFCWFYHWPPRQFIDSEKFVPGQ